MSNYTPHAAGDGLRAKIQRFGSKLAGMVMPNIGAFIAWGLITAIFIPDGWIPNKDIATLVSPMILFLLPLLIGFTGGKMVHGHRGGVVGAVATMGVIVGTDVPMFLGAMIMGPLGGWIIMKLDESIEGKVKPGFEMLIDNFTAGIVGMLLAIVGLKGAGPVVEHLTTWLGNGVEKLVDNNMLPLASFVIEPAKVLFLNNAINHGVLTPLGVTEAAEKGKSVLFMLESNPGPGLGILLAYWLFGPRSLRASAPAAIIIQFFGGIHEIYFPYILMKPKLILAVIAGGAAGIATFQLTGAGLVASPSPGSIFAYLAQTPKGFGNYGGMLLGVTVSAAVSFFVASLLLGFGHGSDDESVESDTEMQEA
ncbi:PTS mannose transporter subunit IIA [Aeromicrobium sp. A1-2]|uniref:PTS mannitol transporter subunit IICB n=1 Tax=Aeromicrobium sp. A1-2 TaxID=2107713 RepID=UPI000E4B57F7|nr:PTS mannitol transporter subunit IICB [Aeromicrobium sp. A1-2]AXT84480.1 PTS mannose transporter subunit IIA [Aeromicrobium sp. A1-2]